MPSLKARDVIRGLREFGFYPARHKGSHIIFQHLDGWTTVVPSHQGQDIGRGLLRAILREANISLEEFMNKL